MLDVTEQSFENEVIGRSQEVPVLCDFWAPWCAPCRVLSPLLEKLEREFKGRFVLAKINTEDNPRLAYEYRVQSIPEMKLFREGQVVAELTGALPEPQLRAWLEENVPSRARQALLDAKEAKERGQTDLAVRMLEDALANDPDDPEIRINLAQMLFLSDTPRAMSLLDGLDEHVVYGDQAQSLRSLSRFVLLASGETRGMEGQKGFEDYRRAAEHLRQGDYDGALESLLQVVRKNRRLDDDGAQRACLAIFDILGEQHPVTQRFRRQLAMALF